MPHPVNIIVAVVLALLAQTAAAAPARAPAPAATRNCALAAPPLDAGIDLHMGALLRIYPRNPAIGPDYDGCQTLWVRDDDGWAPITVVHYEHGHVVRVDSPAQPGDPIEQCLVKAGVVQRGDPGLCGQLDDMRFESLPAACLDAADAPRCVRE